MVKTANSAVFLDLCRLLLSQSSVLHVYEDMTVQMSCTRVLFTVLYRSVLSYHYQAQNRIGVVWQLAYSWSGCAAPNVFFSAIRKTGTALAADVTLLYYYY